VKEHQRWQQPALVLVFGLNKADPGDHGLQDLLE
jgi:hypothetical protein